MPKPTKPPPKPLTPAEEFARFQRLRRIRKREAAHAARIERARAAAEDTHARRHARRLDRKPGTVDALERQIRLMELYPSPLAAARLGEILADPATPEGCRVKAASLILKFAHHGDGPSPG